MPLIGSPNNRPKLRLPGIGEITPTQHDQFAHLDTKSFSPLSYFAEPPAKFLNHATRERRFSKIGMVGISGGGWTTTLLAALDPRITHSYPVAGILPLYLRGSPNPKRSLDWGDWEQWTPTLYRRVNYLDMYLLGSSGEGRSQLQILNQFDSCCFAGINFLTYEPVIKRLARAVEDGRFDVFLDSSHKEHKISKRALSRITHHFFQQG